MTGSITAQVDWWQQYGEPNNWVKPVGMSPLNDSILLTLWQRVHPETRRHIPYYQTFDRSGNVLEKRFEDIPEELNVWPQLMRQDSAGNLFTVSLQQSSAKPDGPWELRVQQFFQDEDRLLFTSDLPEVRSMPLVTGFFAMDMEGGFLIATQLDRPELENDFRTILLQSFDQNGQLRWERSFTDEHNYGIGNIMSHPDGSYYLGATLNRNNYVLQIDASTGATMQEWELFPVHFTPSGLEVHRIAYNPFDGNVYAAVRTGSNVRVAKLSDDGTYQISTQIIGHLTADLQFVPNTDQIRLWTERTHSYRIYEVTTDTSLQSYTHFVISSNTDQSFPITNAIRLRWGSDNLRFFRYDRLGLGVSQLISADAMGLNWHFRDTLENSSHGETLRAILLYEDGYMAVASGVRSEVGSVSDEIMLFTLTRIGELIREVRIPYDRYTGTARTPHFELQQIGKDSFQVLFSQRGSHSHTHSLGGRMINGQLEIIRSFAMHGTYNRDLFGHTYTLNNGKEVLLYRDCCDETADTKLIRMRDINTLGNAAYVDTERVLDENDIRLYLNADRPTFWLASLEYHIFADTLQLLEFNDTLHQLRKLRIPWTGALPPDRTLVEDRAGGVFFIATGELIRPEGRFSLAPTSLEGVTATLKIAENIYVVGGTLYRGASYDPFILRYRSKPNTLFDSNLNSAEFVRVFPNPSRGFIQVQLPSEVSGDVRWQVIASDGRIVVSPRDAAVDSQHNFAVDLTGLGSGNYFITITSGDKAWYQTIALL